MFAVFKTMAEHTYGCADPLVKEEGCYHSVMHEARATICYCSNSDLDGKPCNRGIKWERNTLEMPGDNQTVKTMHVQPGRPGKLVCKSWHYSSSPVVPSATIAKPFNKVNFLLLNEMHLERHQKHQKHLVPLILLQRRL